MNDKTASRIAAAYWTTAPATGELREERLPEVNGSTSSMGGEAVQVRTLASGVSRGTEALVHAGRVPPSEFERMRAPFQKGDFPFPVKYGYMSVGEVEAGPDSLVGRRVFCLHPHQDRYVVPAVAAVPLPDAVPSRRAVLAANVETAVNVLWDARPSVGDRVVVVGAGVVGLLTAWLARSLAGTRVALLDVQEARRGVAATLGLELHVAENAAGAPGSLQDADLVIHASGSPAGLSTALGLAGDEATVVEASWFGDRPVSLPLGEAFHARRLRVVSSQVGTIPPHRTRRWTHRRRLELALELLTAPELDALLTSDDPFTDIVTALPRALADPATLCATLSY